jgi:perosamine synthetase
MVLVSRDPKGRAGQSRAPLRVAANRENGMDLFHTHISERSIELATQALRSTFVSEGKLVREFEATLSAQLGLVRPTAVNSGTSALHLALDVAGVGPGDEVILPAQTFIATGLVILQQRARPVFADIDPMTGNLDPASFRRKITPRTRAVMPVHWAGYPCEMDEINAIAREHRIAVIEDAAHALGATYRGKPIGAVSRFTAFSFQAIKHLTTGDGGALCCLDEKDARLAFKRRWFGIDRANDKPDILGERVYNLDHVGYKYHMNDLAAAVGLGNLHDFPRRLERRRAIAARYRRDLAGTPGLTLLREDPDRESAYWLFTVRVERREDFIRKLAGQGIPASVVHLRIDRNSVFGGIREDLAGQAAFNAEQVAIPVHEGLTDDEVNSIVRSIHQGW